MSTHHLSTGSDLSAQSLPCLADLILGPPCCIPAELPLGQAADLLARTTEPSDAGALVVLKEEWPVGIVTLRDLLRWATTGTADPSRPVSTVMSSPLIVLPGEATLASACDLLARAGLGRLGVTDPSGRLIGLVTRAALSAAWPGTGGARRRFDRPIGDGPERAEQPIGGDSPDQDDPAALHLARLEALLANTSDLAWDADIEGRFTFVSGRVREILGYEPEWLIGRSVFDLMPPDEARRVTALFADIVAAARPFRDLENTCLHRDGGRRVLATSGVPLLTPDGRLFGYRGLCRDITETHRAIAAHREGEAQLRAIFETANVGIMLLTGYRMLERCNRRLAEILGYDSPEELQGLSMRTLHLSEERFAAFGKEHYLSLRFGQRRHIEYQLSRRDGSPVWCLLSGQALDLSTPADLSLGVVWTVDDISARKTREAELRALMDAIPDLISFKDQQGIYLDCNLSFARFVGRPREGILGRKDGDLFAPEVAALLGAQDRAMPADGEPARNQEWVTYPDGTRHLLDTLKLAYAQTADEHLGVLGISRDITEQHWQTRDFERAQALARIGSLHVDLASHHSHWSDNLFRIFGLNPTRALPSDAALLARVVPEDRPRLEAVFGALQRGEIDHATLDYRILRPDGEIRVLASQRELTRDEHGAPVRIDAVVQDITDQRRAQQALAESESRYRTLFEHMALALALVNADGLFNAANQAFCDLLGYPTPETLLGAAPSSLSPPVQPDGEASGAKAERMIALARERGLQRFEWEHVSREGAKIPVEITLSAVQLDGQPVLLAALYDLRDRQRAEEWQRRASTVFTATRDGILITDPDARIVAVNPAFSAITGYEEDEVLGRRPNLLQSGRQDRRFYQAMWQALTLNDHWQGQLWNRRKDGELFAEWLTISAIRNADGQVQNYIGIFSDITKAERAAAEIDHLTHHDLLTNLPNATLFRARLDQIMRSARTRNRQVAVLVLNLDGFKHVVSAYGHSQADAVLVQVGRVLTRILPADAALARLGADTFAVGVATDPGAEAVSEHVARIQETLRRELRVEGIGPLGVGVGLGVALCPSDSCDATELLHFADSALNTAKAAGHGSWSFFRPEMTAAASERLRLAQALRAAVASGELILYLQPKLDLSSGRIAGAEALIRWRTPAGTLSQPHDFMPVVETSDLVWPVGRWVIEEAARIGAEWQTQGFSDLRISVNVSSAMIGVGQLPGMIAAATEAVGVDPALLEIEVLENVLINRPEDAGKDLAAIRALGVGVALDDFGTGYSNLAYLKRFAFDTLKIDRAFIGDLRLDTEALTIVRATISMAHQLGLQVVAEGVESAGQLDRLFSLGCDFAQGYAIGEPMAPEAFATLLRATDPMVDGMPVRELLARRALLVEDDPIQRAVFTGYLHALGWRLWAVASAEEARDHLVREDVHLLLADYHLPGEDGVSLLEHARALHPEVVRVLISADEDATVVTSAINRGGVFRFLPKPCSQQQIADICTAGFALARLLRQAGPLVASRVQH
jgi:diguanylate cyclase (GGDEF)-like protein/PAS domain S-box-containing protein